MNDEGHTPIARAILESSYDSVHDFRFLKDDILFKLLNDTLIKSFIHKHNLKRLDTREADFSLASLCRKGDYYFGDVMMPCMVEIEDNIRPPLTKSPGTSSRVVESNKIKESIILHIILLLEKSLSQFLFSADYKAVPTKDILRINLCRWILISEFLKPEDKLQSVILFKGSLANLLE